MGRAAGDSSSYIFRLYNQSNGKYDRRHEIHLESVTTVIKATLAAPALIGWAERLGREHLAGLLSTIPDLEAVADEENGLTWRDILVDPDLNYELFKDNKLLSDDVKEEAGEAGRENHSYLERLAAVSLEQDDDAADRYAERPRKNGWQDAISAWWLARSGFCLSSEEFLYSLRHGYAGTLDLAWKDEKGLGIIDLKCRGEGRTAHEGDHVQVGAYALAYEEMHGVRVDWRSVLVARPDGTFEEYESLIDPTTFLHLLATRRAIKAAEVDARERKRAAKEVK